MKFLTVPGAKMADTDWMRIAISAAVGLGSGVVSAIGTAFTMGRRGARQEQAVKDDYVGRINDLREEVKKDVAAIKDSSTESRDLLIDHFRETLEGLRRQMDTHQLLTEREFLRKGEFQNFLAEYREGQRRTDDKLDRLLGMKQ